MNGGAGREWRDHTPDFLDEVAVEIALQGRDVGRPLHRAERIRVAELVKARGGTATEVATVIGCSQAEAQRLVNKLPQEAKNGS